MLVLTEDDARLLLFPLIISLNLCNKSNIFIGVERQVMLTVVLIYITVTAPQCSTRHIAGVFIKGAINGDQLAVRSLNVGAKDWCGITSQKTTLPMIKLD